MNILVTSAGRRVKVVEYFKKELHKYNGKVIATDCDVHAPALYFADQYEIVPRINDKNYIFTLLEISKKHNIDGIISLIDPELGVLAEHRVKFEEIGVKLILSPREAIEFSFDKLKTFKYLKEKEIPTVPTYKDLEKVLTLVKKGQLTYPLIVKPAKGSASLGIYLVENDNELIESFSKSDDQIIQPYYKDKEFGIDVYVDMLSGELIDMFIKEKIRMRAGETDKSISVHNEGIEKLIKDFVHKTDFLGPIDIDCFEYNNRYYISEINPRFGGGYPHAYELGCNFMSYIVKNLENKENIPYKALNYEENKVMLKYDRTYII